MSSIFPNYFARRVRRPVRIAAPAVRCLSLCSHSFAASSFRVISNEHSFVSLHEHSAREQKRTTKASLIEVSEREREHQATRRLEREIRTQTVGQWRLQNVLASNKCAHDSRRERQKFSCAAAVRESRSCRRRLTLCAVRALQVNAYRDGLSQYVIRLPNCLMHMRRV